MQKINLGDIEIPIVAVTKTFAFLAKRGAGKTWAACVLAEEFHKYKMPFVVIDPIDVWYGLRLKANGKDKGLPVVVFGLEHADIKLDKDMGPRIAQEICRQNISCIISTFGMSKTSQRHLIAEFAEELLRINNTPRHVFVEEAHEFVPQRVSGSIGKCFSAVESLVVMGRNRGIGVSLINQRAATINKDVLTQLDTLIALRSIGPQDAKALQEWVKQHAAQGDFDQFINSLPSLPTGEAWIWSPEFLGVFRRIHIRQRETFHPDREKLGHDFVVPDLDQADIQKFIDNFQVKDKTKPKPTNAVEDVLQSPVLKRDFERELIDLKNEYESKIIQKDMVIRELQGKIDAVKKIIGNGGIHPQFEISSCNTNVEMWLKKLGTGAVAKIFKFMADKSGMKFTRSQIGLAVGYSPNSGRFRTNMATLKRNELIKEDNGYCMLNPDL